MTREQLLRAVGDIRDTFIREAAPPPASYRKRREFPWAGAVAACLALVIVGSTFFLSQLGMGSGDTSANDTASAAERARYDEKALCRFMGKLMFALAVCQAVMGLGAAWAGMWLYWLGIGLFLASALGGAIYANTGGRFLKRTKGE